MKSLGILALVLTNLCHGRQVDISWNAAPSSEMVVGWRVWQGITLIASSSVPTATLNLTNEAATITVTAINSAGESPHSAPLNIPSPMMWIQKSSDLETWTNVVQIPYVEPRQFIRLQIPPP